MGESTPSSSAGTSFVAFPGLLVIRLVDRCNQRCRFCMARDEIAASNPVDYDEAIAAIAGQPECQRVEFFGGEPTLHPRFLDLVRFARERRHQCSIATNGRRLSDERFVDALAALGSAAIYLRTSIYGDTAETHDYYTNVGGSHAQTVRGIGHAVARGFTVQVNIVILRGNCDRLETFPRQVAEWGARRIKFGSLVDVESCPEHAVPLSDVSPHLVQAIALAERLGLTVTVEKTPICTIGGRVDLVSTERALGNWPRAFDDGGACRGCVFREWCDGLDPGYAARFGLGGIHRMEKVPAIAIERCRQREPEFLKMHCALAARLEAGDRDARELRELSRLVTAQHGRLAVFRDADVEATDD